jgi:hypothetical protein
LVHLSLQPTNATLQQARTLESVVDGKRKIGLSLVHPQSAPGIDLATVRSAR